VLVIEANFSFEMSLVVCFQPLDKIPLEVVEMIVMKAAASLHRVLRMRLLPRADVITLRTLYSVCWMWWMMLTGRKFNKRQIRWLFTEKVSSFSKSQQTCHLVQTSNSCKQVILIFSVD
jgi:hypothetical protein